MKQFWYRGTSCHWLKCWYLSPTKLSTVHRDYQTNFLQCWKFPQVRQFEADNFGGGPATFCWFFFNLMFMIWDSRHGELQLFWLSFKHWFSPFHHFPHHSVLLKHYFDGLEQDCSNSIVNTLELLQSCTKPSIYTSNMISPSYLTGVTTAQLPQHSSNMKLIRRFQIKN